MAAYGLTVPAGGVCIDEPAAVRLARTLGGPVALKLVDSTVLHKSESGLVSLAVDGDERVRFEFRRLAALSHDATPRVLIEEMVAGDRELLIGLTYDQIFGPVMVFGVGGIFAEVHRDIALAALPLEPGDVRSLFESIRARDLLGPIRGLPPVDQVALIATIEALAVIAADHADVAEIEVNPLVVAGSRLVASDAVIVLRSKKAMDVVDDAQTRRADLSAVLGPRAVAVVGASNDLGKWGGRVFNNVLGGGYVGEVYAVNPRARTVSGRLAYGSLADLPTVPDLVIIAVESGLVPEVIDQCIAQRVKAALVISSGFSETGAAGAAAEQALAAKAEAGGLVLVGPNCMGVISTHDRLFAVGYFPLQPSAGGLSVVSQSGNIGVQLLAEAERRGMGIDKYVTVGNEASVAIVDVLDQLAREGRTEAILVYLEGVRKGHRFGPTLRRLAAKKPVVLLRGGLTASGGRAAASHTGAMAGRSDVFLAVARQSGCVVCTDPDEAMDAALCLANLPPAGGSRIAIVTLGGGWGVLAADEVVRNQLTVADLEPETIHGLGEVLPAFWSHSNPVDIVGAVNVDISRRVLELVTQANGVDAVLFLGVLGSPVTGHVAAKRTTVEPTVADREVLALVRDLMASTGRPIVCVPFCPLDTALARDANGRAPVVLASPIAAVRALAAHVRRSMCIANRRS